MKFVLVGDFEQEESGVAPRDCVQLIPQTTMLSELKSIRKSPPWLAISANIVTESLPLYGTRGTSFFSTTNGLAPWVRVSLLRIVALNAFGFLYKK